VRLQTAFFHREAGPFADELSEAFDVLRTLVGDIPVLERVVDEVIEDGAFAFGQNEFVLAVEDHSPLVEAGEDVRAMRLRFSFEQGP
jgi:hypothetical protein